MLDASPDGSGAPRRDDALFRLLVESVSEYAIFLLDVNGRVASWNAGAERIKGYRADEILGRHLSVLYPPEDAARGVPARALAEAEARGSHVTEGWRLRKDGSRFHASVVLTALRGPTGALTGFAKVTRDDTDRVRAEAERQGLATATEAVRDRDEFLAVASHELRTPVAALQLVIQALRRQVRAGAPATAQVVERLAQADRLVSRLGGLVTGLVDLATLATGQLALERAPCDLSVLAAEVIALHRGDAERSGGVIRLDAPVPVTAHVDRRRLGQALSAVLENAVKYGGAGPITVAVGCDATTAELAVTDLGPGIAEEDQGRVFERFERAVPVEHFGGFGVGLWTCRLIVAAHGGEIRLASAPGRGARFALRVPVAAPPAPGGA